MAKKEVVYQANPLIEGRREFDVMETRLFYLGLRGVVPKLTNKDTVWTARDGFADDFPITTIPTNELIALFGSDKYYNTLEEVCKKLAKKTVEARTIDKEGNEGFSVYPVFAELSYKSKTGLKIEFNGKMKPWLLDLANKPFTKLPFEQVWKLSFQKKEPYAIRLFELLLQYRNTKTKERVLTIEDLKLCLGMEANAYEGRNNTFREKVIEPSVKAINQVTFYRVDYEPVKKGHKTIAFKFRLHLPNEVAKETIKKNFGNVGDIIGSVVSNLSIPGTPSDSQKQKEVKSDKMTITAQKLTPKMDFQEQEKQLPLSEQPLSDLEFEMLKEKGFDGNNFNMANVNDRCLAAHIMARGLSMEDIKAGKR